MILRFIGYFLYLRKLIGFPATVIFSFYYVVYKSGIIRPKIGMIPVGPIDFYFTSVKQFAGLFMEIFLKQYYYLKKTDLPIKVIDCGANIGVSLLYIKLMAPNAQVKCFEPNPAALAILNKNIQANGWGKDVSVRPYALGKTKGRAEFFVDRDEATSYGASLSKYMAGKHALVSFPVQIDRLSDYISGPIDFLKVDIEGAEFDVLEDLSENNKLADISQIQFEYHYHPKFFPKPLSEILEILKQAGFQTKIKEVKNPNLIARKDFLSASMVYGWKSGR
ncbi:MAG: hypothetical protein A3I39_03000 [Candidatus Yanofskybacteria bacterium RIFCSPLOWO2_02_FULL_47_9b]|uniref:Methyltransferase FkbM domain-containing protein n=1 Tax=Candidatus Yanofskybacteria bacterium RIFCSPLOWO2_02_FULL_47_9b TaxID=1802708 RepID=A0A1F8H883_9BACT|nr:MAG: hypothetical protein A3I39_03000 [Candidatus Yanofskybacteria bacterium RIFCSPLOWO2_02_FULL_47_9b]